MDSLAAKLRLNRPGIAGGSITWENGVHGKRECIFTRGKGRLVLEHQSDYSSQWQAICSIAGKIGCSEETLRKWFRQSERDQGLRPGLTSAERERMKQLERENREPRRANEILRKAAAFGAQAELDRKRR